MHARVLSPTFKPDKMDEGISIFSGPGGLAAMQQKGCKGLLSIVDRKTRKCIFVTLWETEADMTVTETGEYWEAGMSFAVQLFGARPTVEHYEVIAQA